MRNISGLRRVVRWAGVMAVATSVLAGTVTAAGAAPVARATVAPAVADGGIDDGNALRFPAFVLQLDGASVEAVNEVSYNSSNHTLD
ncbi:hypothetical protein [Streptomyces sp. NPDC053720]|uniref:hypothetical protein n=1 Tax=Streptomyces sp. NPDC053720 TaxID=3154855 RepID=UPI00343D159B